MVQPGNDSRLLGIPKDKLCHTATTSTFTTQEITNVVASLPAKNLVDESKKEVTRAAVGTRFQLRSELPSTPNTATQTGIDDKCVGNFDYTIALLNKGAIGYWRYKNYLAPSFTPVEIDIAVFGRAMVDTLSEVLRRQLMKKTEIPGHQPIKDQIDTLARILAAGCCFETYLNVRDLTLAEMPSCYASASIRKPDVNSRLAISTGFAFAIQQLGIVNVVDFPSELILIPVFPDAGHTTGVPDFLKKDWNRNAYDQAVEYARDIGIKFTMIDLSQKDGTAWWLFRQVYEDGIFELQCPLPETNFTNSMAIAHSIFLKGDADDPSRRFVDLDPIGKENYGVMMPNPHFGINVSSYDAVSPDVVTNA